MYGIDPELIENEAMMSPGLIVMASSVVLCIQMEKLWLVLKATSFDVDSKEDEMNLCVFSCKEGGIKNCRPDGCKWN